MASEQESLPTEAMIVAVETALSAVSNGHYALLGLDVDATDAEIKRAFRAKALSLHPDKNVHPRAEEMFKAVNEAFNVLSDVARRREYDLALRGVCFREEERRERNKDRWKGGPPPGWGLGQEGSGSAGGGGGGGGGRKKRGKNAAARSRAQAWASLSETEKQGWWAMFEEEENRVRRESNSEPSCDCLGCKARESEIRRQQSHWTYRPWGFGLSYREFLTAAAFFLGGFAAVYRLARIGYFYPGALFGIIGTALYVYITAEEILWNIDRLFYSLFINGLVHAVLIAKWLIWTMVTRPVLILPIGGATYALLIGPESWPSWR